MKRSTPKFIHTPSSNVFCISVAMLDFPDLGVPLNEDFLSIQSGYITRNMLNNLPLKGALFCLNNDGLFQQSIFFLTKIS
ncbi:hypothetical protein M3226_24730 [Neobacillus cucumis]|uniref:hypothetical protein n=1 Tax=Neobacillus cucumis TaxID=1740721 RepID=UPI00203A8AD7|nr:hypothetical protein [Neobacillus cucumis]MCM3728849.1 hypothetical protein [Neobacillus cucumis]